MEIINQSLGLSFIIQKTINVLKKGGLVIFPSDTVYGALVDSENPLAVEKLIRFKNRPFGKPISVFVSDLSMAKKYVSFNEKQLKIFNHLFPGPFTLILPSFHLVDRRLESEKGTLGVRLIDFLPVVKLTKKFGKPITATSANLAGKPPHYSIESLIKQLPKEKKEMIDLVVDFGKLPRNKPSTVVDLTRESLKILRSGDLNFVNEKVFVSSFPKETKKIAQYFFKKKREVLAKKPLVFIIEGELGVGKTVFVKGIGEFLGIDKIVSPTFVVFYEYDLPKLKNKDLVKIKKLIHVDLYNVQDEEEFEYLNLEDLLQKGYLMLIEWGEKMGDLYEKLKERGEIVYVKIEYLEEKKRKISFQFN